MKWSKQIAAIRCRWSGHDWLYDSGYKRHCKRCDYEEAVWLNRFPRIGEPASEWGPSPSQILSDALES